jgi:hypothetical protein
MFVPLQVPGGPELLIIALNLVLLVVIIAAALSLVRWVRSGGGKGERFGRVEREVGGL